MLNMPENYVHSPLLPLALSDVKERHILITGSKGIGKSTGLTYLVSSEECDGIRTYAVRDNGFYPIEIRLETYFNSSISEIAATKRLDNTGLIVNSPTFEQIGVDILENCIASKKEWVIIDEIGFLESTCPKYCQKIKDVMQTKRLIAVIAKRDVPFLKELLATNNALVIDLDKGVK